MLTATFAPTLLGDAAPASFKCNATICYAVASAETDAEIKRLQTLLNQIGPWAGYPSIQVDGFVGRDVMDRLAKAVAWGKKSSETTGMANALSANVAGGKEYVTERIFGTVGGIENLIANAPASAKKKVPVSAPSGGSSPATVPPDYAFASVPARTTSARWPYYVAGGIGAAAILYGAFHFSKQSALPSPAMAGARRRRSRR